MTKMVISLKLENSMDRIAEKAKAYQKKVCSCVQAKGYAAGFTEAQTFIPVTEEYPPYDEDILIQTRVNVYYGKLKVTTDTDMFYPDLAPPEERVRAKDITAWRPVFYKYPFKT
jgi:hypothetical protein